MIPQLLKEIIYRMGQKSPSFFVKIRYICGIICLFTWTLVQLQHMGVHLGTVLSYLASQSVAIGTGIGVFISSLPVENYDKLKEKIDGTSQDKPNN